MAVSNAYSVYMSSSNQRLGSVLDVTWFSPKLMMMSSAPEKTVGDARYTSQDPFVDRSTIPYSLNSNLY